jgi:S-adenosylmethionine synthetase
MRKIVTSESVSEGHPDKVCDQISDAILDACLRNDPNSRVACETLTTTDLIVVSGEITTNSDVDFEAVAREVVRGIGYTHPDIGFSADDCTVQVFIHSQSVDISQGVSTGEGMYEEQGAGDQGMMFGYACRETPELMPAPVHYSHKIVQKLAELRKGDPATYGYLRPDSKSQVSLVYDGNTPVAVDTVVVSHQHTEDMQRETLEALVKDVVHEVIPGSLLGDGVRYLINPTGRFVVGGPHGDTGLTGRKIIVDTYGGLGHHGGGAFSGKDPSKVDRSAAYYTRYVAKNIVAANLADRCEVQVSYAIGFPEPVSVFVDTFGTGHVSDEALCALIKDGGIFNMAPAGIVRDLGLTTPYSNGWCYQETAAYGHFGRQQFPWEKTDKANDLNAALKG